MLLRCIFEYYKLEHLLVGLEDHQMTVLLMILNDRGILSAIARRLILIEPFDTVAVQREETEVFS